jgi:hypothetical protein
LAAARSVLAHTGGGPASIRFTDEAGVPQGDSDDAEWVYPDNSFFAPETVNEAAFAAGLGCEWVHEYRQRVTASAPTNFHD